MTRIGFSYAPLMFTNRSMSSALLGLQRWIAYMYSLTRGHFRIKFSPQAAAANFLTCCPFSVLIPSPSEDNLVQNQELALSFKTLISPAVVPKWITLFEIILWNNFAVLNMWCAPFNAAHFEGRWVWLSFNINFYKDGTPPAPPSVHHCLYHIWCTQRPGWLGKNIADSFLASYDAAIRNAEKS